MEIGKNWTITMTYNKELLTNIRSCLTRISKRNKSTEMLELLNMVSNLLANEVDSRQMRGAKLQREFTLEELKIIIRYTGDLCQK